MNIIFLGEAGSGKTELAINTAMEMSERGIKEIVLIDIDQTKALFRLREKASLFCEKSIAVKWGKQLLDVPVSPSGIREIIKNPEKICIIDVGGNAAGAVQLGQFRKDLNCMPKKVYYCINPYRPFTGKDEICKRIKKIQDVSGIDDIRFICNPNMGDLTTKEDILEGIDILEKTLSSLGFQIDKVVVLDRFYDQLKQYIHYDLIRLKRYIMM